MIEDYLAAGAYKVTKAAHCLYNAASATTLTLTGTLPSVSFRCSVRLYTATGKTDCAGRVTVGSENLDFLAAGKKITTTILTALPSVTTQNLSCMIEILAIDSGGAPIETETLTAIDTRIESHSSLIPTANGLYTVVQDTQIISNTLLAVNDVVRKGTTDYIIKKADDNPDLGQESDFYTYLA